MEVTQEMLDEVKAETGSSIPYAPSHYAKWPFDPALVAYRDNEGHEYRYMNSPLDETYLAEPVNHFAVGTIPPEECEVRDTLLAAVLMRKEVSSFQFWWSQFIKPTKSYLRALEYFRRLDQLCTLSPEYRAAFCRLSGSTEIPKLIRADLKRIVTKYDSGQA